METTAAVRPRLRGVLHQHAFFAAVAAGVLLVATAERARLGALVYALGLAGLLGISALYHRVTWGPAAQRFMRRLDHAMIFVFIATTATPVALLALEGTSQTVLLAVTWGGAAAGIALELLWPGAPKWADAAAYCAVGWAGAVAIPQLAVFAVASFVLIAVGGVLYTAGAVVYATGRPDPAPAVFGYHEVFHTLVVVAAVLHFTAVGLLVL